MGPPTPRTDEDRVSGVPTTPDVGTEPVDLTVDPLTVGLNLPRPVHRVDTERQRRSRRDNVGRVTVVGEVYRGVTVVMS